MNTSFWKAGHAPTLFAAFLYFDLSFMVWYLLGPLAVQIATDLDLNAQQRGLMVATPILAGAVLRLLIQRPGDPLSKTQILDRLVSVESDMNPEAIEVIIHRLRKRLAHAPIQIVTLRGIGYLLEHDEDDG